MKTLIEFFSGRSNVQRLYPRCYEDVLDILQQATDNGTPVKVTGGTFPTRHHTTDIVIDLRYMNKLIGLDVTTSTVIVESGIILSDLESILESVALSIDSFGRIPNLTVVDAISVGAFGGNASLLSSIASIEVILSNGKIMSWNWERNPVEMKTVCCGLGMAGVIISATFKCIPIQKFTEVSYLCSIRDVMEQWSMQFKSSFCQQLTWFPFSELMVMTHLNPSDPYSNESSQPWLNFVLEKAFDYFSWFIRQIGIFASQYDAPVFNSVLSRIQFIAQWSIAKNRSDYSHSPIRFWSPNESCQWTAWLIPQDKLPHVLYNISAWANSHPNSDTICGISPLFIQSLKVDKNMIQKKPYLAPYLDRPAVTVWYDWFIPKIDPNPIAISEFEDIFHSVGAVRAWYGERLTSPLVLNHIFKKYEKWCSIKSRLDSENILNSAYIHGTVYSPCFRKSLNECSSISSSMLSLFAI
ncbi:L-gulonolactone oxidase [Lepeophtheirus salmonis]|nr:L-gulonolactone oxidase-like [Lepeophtheirus salmonis]